MPQHVIASKALHVVLHGIIGSMASLFVHKSNTECHFVLKSVTSTRNIKENPKAR